MLVISRREGEEVLIGDGGTILVKVLACERGRVKLGFMADVNIPILRRELVDNPTGRMRIQLEGETDAAEDQ